MKVGDTVRFDRYRERISVGDDYVFEFAVNVSGGDACGPLVKGDPVDGTGVTVTGSARVLGTFQRLQVIATKASNGSSTEPMRIRLKVDSGDAANALLEGALGGFAIQARITVGTVKKTVLKGLVNVLDAASWDATP